MKGTNTSNLAKGSIFIALTIIILYLGNLITFNTLFLLGISAALIPLCIIMCDVKTAVLVYAASTLLAYFIIPDKSIFLYYALIFGPYGIIKLLIEKRNNSVIEIILKLVYFNLAGFILFTIFKYMIFAELPLNYPPALLLVIVNIVFFVFDYVLTVFVNFATKRKL